MQPADARPSADQLRSPVATSSRAGRDEELDADVLRLTRIHTTVIAVSARKNHHRLYKIQITKVKSSPSGNSEQGYALEYRYSAFLGLSAILHKVCESSALECTACGTMLDGLHHGCAPSVLQQLFFPPSCRYGRLNKFIEQALGHVRQFSIPNASVCTGCKKLVKTLGPFLKEPYQASTGIM